MRANIFCLLVAVGGLSGQVRANDDHVLTIGRVSSNPESAHQELKPILDYMVGELSDFGITEGQVLVAPDNRFMLHALNSNQVDWVSETIASATVYERQTGAEIALVRWKDGVRNYHSVVVARRDSNINSLADLKGKRVALEHVGSTSGYYLPAYQLLQLRYPLQPMSTPREPVLSGSVGYIFAHKEENMALWLHKGLVAAIGFADLNYNDPSIVSPEIRPELKIIYKSPPVPRAVEMFRKDLDKGLKDRMIALLGAAHENPKAQYALGAYGSTRKFEPFVPEEWEIVARLPEIIERVAGEFE